MKPAIEAWNPCLETLEGHKAAIESLQWAPNGVSLKSVGSDGVIKIWDLAGSRCVSSLDGGGGWNTCTAWSDDSAYIATTSRSLKIQIWDPNTGQCLISLLGHDSAVKAVFWSQDTMRLVSVSGECGKSPLTIKVWDRQKGKCLMTIKEGGDDMDHCIILPSHDGKSLVSVSSHGISKTWEIFTDHILSSRNIYSPRSSMSLFSRDGMSIIYSDWMSSRINILGRSGEECITALDTNKSFLIVCLALSYDGIRLASGSADGLIEIWDLTTNKSITTLEGHSGFIKTMVWLKDGRIASGSNDRTIKIWNPSTRQCLSTLKGHGGTVRSLLLSADEKRILSASQYESNVKIWDLNSSVGFEEHSQYVEGIVWSDDGRYLASHANMETKIWDPLTGECLSTIECRSGTFAKICWSPSGKLASISSDGTLEVWEVLTGHCYTRIESVEPTAWPVWSKDGERLMSASYDNFINTWNANTGQHLSTVKAERIGHGVTWSHDATMFASVAENWSIMIQDQYTGNCILHLKGHSGPEVDKIPLMVRRLPIMTWSRDGTKLASAMGPTIKIWDVTTGQCILALELDDDPRTFHFNFPRGPLFGETDPGYLHTTMGSFSIEPYVDSTTDTSTQLVCSPQPVGFGINWSWSSITRNGVDILELPRDYRADGTKSIAISGSTVVLGCVTGRVFILRFSKDVPLEH
ncbi:hypothetical protein N7466_005117 [Penicillium verhagenii]|uniref:uncharacterized protein n=1 Tax=Penicillium verhagenii TaxID=1562060 RepID=UPI002545087D|nr:uncharacterized protein N7466_005117 [Penicillium verhagenii]KAJ5935570.1 hypothetical protein N7466_005117 [Penicillium verhagenii]